MSWESWHESRGKVFHDVISAECLRGLPRKEATNVVILAGCLTRLDSVPNGRRTWKDEKLKSPSLSFAVELRDAKRARAICHEDNLSFSLAYAMCASFILHILSCSIYFWHLLARTASLSSTIAANQYFYSTHYIHHCRLFNLASYAALLNGINEKYYHWKAVNNCWSHCQL